ncbi:MAG: hypothetical protein ACRDDX_01260 [Cellulosilyticaceae bacterium]
MITLALTNVLDSSRQALQFIYQTTQTKGLKVHCISPENNILYMHNKRLPLRHYIQELEKENACDLLIVDLSKEAMRKQLYEHLKFHVVILFEAYEKKNKVKRVHVTQQVLSHMHTNYYILPDKYRHSDKTVITYGWSKDAHISATSAQKTADGYMEMQCCIGQSIATIDGQTIPLKEFGVASSLDSIDGVLAGVAALVLYGIDLGQYNKN